MDVTLADMCVEAAEDPHRPGLRYTKLLIIFFSLEFVDNCCSSLIESDISFSAPLSRTLWPWVGNGISEFSWVVAQRRLLRELV